MQGATVAAVRALALLSMLLVAGAPTAHAADRGTLSQSARPGLLALGGAQLASNGRGVAAAIWRTYSPSRGTALRVATRDGAGNWSRPRTVVRRSGSPGLLRYAQVDVSERGAVRATWAARDATAATFAIVSRVRSRAGRWADPLELASGIAVRGIDGDRLDASASFGASGEGVVAWCRGGHSTNLLDQSNPGTVFVRSLAADGTVAEPVPIWTGRSCAAPTVEVNRRGDGLLSWGTLPPDLDDAPRLFVIRSAGGRWSATPAAVPELGEAVDDQPWLRLGRGGQLALFNGGSAYYARTQIWHATLGADGTASGASEVPLPSGPMTSGGLIGQGPTALTATTLDDRGDPVVLFGGRELAIEGGRLGTSALWAATRRGTGRWQTSLVDDLAEVSAPLIDSDADASLTRDAKGRLVATWTAATSDAARCRTPVFQSTRPRGAERWTRRALVADIAGVCGERALSPVAAAPLVWWESRKTIEVRPLRAATQSTPPPRVTLRTPTWAAIRAAGAIEFLCEAPRAGICHLSLLDAVRRPSVLDHLEAYCRPLLASVRLTGSQPRAVLRFPIADGCYEGGPRPELPSQAVRFSVRAVADAVGYRSAARTFDVEVGVR